MSCNSELIRALSAKKNNNIFDFGKNYLVPLYSCSAQAGFPSPADDYIEMHLDLNKYLIQHPASTFFFKASGNSMRHAGIFNGDILLVDRSLEAAHDNIVIATVDGEFAVKRLSKVNGHVQLLSERPPFKSLDVTDISDLCIWGVVTYVIHKALKLCTP